MRVVARSEWSYQLDAGESIISLPIKFAMPGIEVGDTVSVFVYLDSSFERLATCQKPLAQVGECAWLRVVDQSGVGDFLNWGLSKDLLLPYSEQRFPVDVGRYCLVKVLYDERLGIFASTYLERYLDDQMLDGSLHKDQAVSLLVAERSELGYKVIVNNQYWGLVYYNEVFQHLRKGQKITGYLKRIREDGRLDISLYPVGHAKTDATAALIMERLREQGGRLALGDKSDPQAIYDAFGVSKKNFKQALGHLLKQRKIKIGDQEIGFYP